MDEIAILFAFMGIFAGISILIFGFVHLNNNVVKHNLLYKI